LGHHWRATVASEGKLFMTPQQPSALHHQVFLLASKAAAPLSAVRQGKMDCPEPADLKMIDGFDELPDDILERIGLHLERGDAIAIRDAAWPALSGGQRHDRLCAAAQGLGFRPVNCNEQVRKDNEALLDLLERSSACEDLDACETLAAEVARSHSQDRGRVLVAVHAHGLALEHASPFLQDDPVIAATALHQNHQAFSSLSPRLRDSFSEAVHAVDVEFKQVIYDFRDRSNVSSGWPAAANELCWARLQSMIKFAPPEWRRHPYLLQTVILHWQNFVDSEDTLFNVDFRNWFGSQDIIIRHMRALCDLLPMVPDFLWKDLPFAKSSFLLNSNLLSKFDVSVFERPQFALYLLRMDPVHFGFHVRRRTHLGDNFLFMLSALDIYKNSVYWSEADLRNNPEYKQAAMRIDPAFGVELFGEELPSIDTLMEEVNEVDRLLRNM
jgi:hypothetical protein